MEEVVAATGTATAVRHELVPQLRFPPGFRFVPTEEELVDVYLRAKIEGRKLPLQVVNDVSILDWQPGKLVEAYKGYGENRWFFFTVREQSSSNKEKEPSRKVRGVPGVTATWKATGSVQVIRRARSNSKVVVGSKRVLIYNSTDPAENGKWSMHEYILQDHAEIGQYALYSIQRKQHSDTEDKAGDDNDMGSEKKTKKRKRTENPCTEPEGVQLPKTETATLLAEPPLKPTRKAKVERKKKPSMQVGVEGEQKQQQQGQSPTVTPPKKDELAPRQQEGRQQPSVAADGAPEPVAGLSAVPLQALRVFPPSELAGMLGAPAPTIEEDALDHELWALLLNNHHPDPAMPFNNQGHQEQPGLTGTTEFLVASDTNVVGHALLQLQPCQQQEDGYNLFGGIQNQHLFLGENQSVYMEQSWQHPDLFLLSNNTTQPMNSSGGGWEHGDDQHHQIHQLQLQEENNGGAFGVVQNQQPMNHPQGSHGLPPVDQQSSGSDYLSGVQMDIDTFVKSLLEPQDLAAGTQEQPEGGGGDDPATLQLQAGTQEQWADATATVPSHRQYDDAQLQMQRFCNLQLQRVLEEHVLDGPCSCIACAAGLWDYFVGL